MKQASDTVYHSNDLKVACARTDTGTFAYIENDISGIRLIKECDTLEEAIGKIADYEAAMNRFWEVFK